MLQSNWESNLLPAALSAREVARRSTSCASWNKRERETELELRAEQQQVGNILRQLLITKPAQEEEEEEQQQQHQQPPPKLSTC